MLASFALALQFLTRLPLNINIKISDQRIAQSVLFYPLVGLIIGILLVLLNQLCLSEQPTGLSAAIILSVWVLLTGGLHLDGLADCSDAWAGGLGDKQRTLAIMKDPAAGPIAVIILILVLLLKWAAIQALLQHTALLALLSAPFIARLSILILMLSTPYVRENGLGSAMQQNLSKPLARLIVCLSLVLFVWLSNVYSLIAVLSVIALIRYLALQRIHGVTGDVYGASVEIVETVVLISWVLSNG
ncbi:MAG: adenosylcobinamide-GDP ribazoletransferase [Methyloprofundus sp.]|nr:adenosylcobinamide-GDP ribazoletransferase [Methyloprofundus sp.]